MSGAQLATIEAFLTVIDVGGFGDAARELGLSQSTVSRRIAQLEDHLGCRLLARSTRHLSLTEAGLIFADEARAALAGLRRAELRVMGEDAILSGAIRMTMPTAYGRLVVVPAIAKLMEQHPRLAFHLNLSDRYVDLLTDPHDIAIRLSDEVPSGWKVVRLGSVGGGLYVAPSYLHRHPEPRAPHDLQSHRLLAAKTYTPRTTWRLKWKNRESVLEIAPVAIISDFAALHDLALEGAGIAALPDYVAAQAVQSGALVEILRGTVVDLWPVFAAYPQHMATDRRLETIVSALQRSV
ncbi:LysR substrate-binding domain-containing protein [Erythrobacter sp. NE805]|uniref:LysR family transcriptional regulator n=1 Tax=Erythrobacter sp. NE805 TaxID=3389875 RepID=UPI00396B3EF8